MGKKTCFKCNISKPLKQFYKHKRMKDGHLNKCKDCTISDVAEHRLANLEKVREYDRKRGSTKKRLSRSTERTRKWRKDFPHKYKAHSAVHRAIVSGKLKRPNVCESCNKEGRQIEGHHDDYSKPLEVVWMCSACHSALHRDLANVADNRIA